MSFVPLNCPVSVCNFPPIGISLCVLNDRPDRDGMDRRERQEKRTQINSHQRGIRRASRPPSNQPPTYSVVVIITIHLSLLLIEMYENNRAARNNPKVEVPMETVAPHCSDKNITDSRLDCLQGTIDKTLTTTTTTTTCRSMMILLSNHIHQPPHRNTNNEYLVLSYSCPSLEDPRSKIVWNLVCTFSAQSSGSEIQMVIVGHHCRPLDRDRSIG